MQPTCLQGFGGQGLVSMRVSSSENGGTPTDRWMVFVKGKSQSKIRIIAFMIQVSQGLVSMSRYVSHHPTILRIFHLQQIYLSFGDVKQIPQAVGTSIPPWPEAAYTRNDMQDFCRMLKARSKSASDVGWWLQDDLDQLWRSALENDEVEWNDTTLQSFLLQIDHCADILTSLPGICERVLQMKIATTSRSNSQNPGKAVEIRSSSNRVYYLSTILNGEDCNCAIKFGGESWKDSWEIVPMARNSE